MTVLRLTVALAALSVTACATTMNHRSATASVAMNAAAVIAADAARFAALVQRDYAALERLLATDLTYCHSNGQCDDKATFLDSLRSGRLRYDQLAASEVKVRLIGDIAIVNGHVRLAAQLNGQKLAATLVYTNVHAWREQAWQMLAWQSTRLP
jgi:ketosteroid isomerase-like protein